MAKRSKDLHYQQAQASHMKFLRFELMKRAESIEENEDRTLEVVFSSDADVEMWYGKERLLHGTDNVDLTYLNAGMSPLLVDHRAYNSDNQIGVIESARVDGHNGYATIKFSKGRRGNEYYQDVLDGIRSCVSVGYEVRKWEIEDADSRDPLYIATEWVPREISFVTFPADESVGVIRSERSDFMFELQNEEDEDMLSRSSLGPEGGQQNTPPETGEPEDEAQRSAEPGNEGAPESQDDTEEPTTDSPARASGGDNYGAEAHQIFELARQLKLDDERAYRAINNQQSFKDFAMEVTKELTNARVNPDGTVEVDDDAKFEGTQVERKDADQFRITNLIAGFFDPDRYGGFEREICGEEAERREKAGMEVHGYTVPGSIVSRSAIYHQQRALAARELIKRTTLTAGTEATAGNLIDSELRPEALIEWLYGEFAVSRAANWIMDVKGNLVIPKQTGRVVAAWGTETAEATESNPTFGTITLSPKELRVLTKFSRTFAIQTSIDAENLVRQKIMESLGEVLDEKLLYGTGSSNEIAGVTTIDGIDTSPNAQRIQYSKDDGVSFEDVLNAVELIGKKNAAGPNMEWIASWGFWKQCKMTPELTNGSRAIWYDNTIADFMATQTSQVRDEEPAGPSNTPPKDADSHQAFIANWQHLLVAMWGGMDIVVDEKTNLDTGEIRVVGFYRVDTGFAHDEAFVKLERTP